MQTLLIKLVEYNVWANRLVTNQIELLPKGIFEKDHGGSFGTLKSTMIHLLESDYLWLKRLEGIPLADIPKWEITDAKSIRIVWEHLQDKMIKATAALSDDRDPHIDFITRKGSPFRMPLNDIILHITHHGSYHRGQLTNMIRMSGENPVSTDYFIFCNR